MTMISSSKASATLFESSQMLQILQSLDADASLQENDASRKKERHFEKQISLQKEKVEKMREQIKAQFKGGLLQNFVGLASNLASNAIGFKMQSLNESIAKTTSEVIKKAQEKMIKILEQVKTFVSHIPGFVETLNPFINKAKKLDAEAEHLEAKSLTESKRSERAGDSAVRARSSRDKIYDAMNNFIRIKQESDKSRL